MNIQKNLHENMTLEEIYRGRVRDLRPEDVRRSFYGKAQTVLMPDHSEMMFSYGSPTIYRDGAGNFFRVLRTCDWSQTTQRHIAAFSGLNKQEFFALPYMERNYNRLSY